VIVALVMSRVALQAGPEQQTFWLPEVQPVGGW